MKTVIINLNYYKQGDDLSNYIDIEKTVSDAFKANADNLRLVADHMDKISFICSKYNISKKHIYADCHYISIECSDDVANELVKNDLGIIDVEE